MIPGAWLNEGGQSAAGAAIDHLVALASRRAPRPPASPQADGMSLPDWLADRAAARAGDLSEVVALAGGVHVVPEFLGNRAPFADPHARAVIAGLGMERDLDSLVALYVAGLCGIGYGLRQIIETQARNGAPIERIVISGGAGRHPTWSASSSPTPPACRSWPRARRSRCCSAPRSSARSRPAPFPTSPPRCRHVVGRGTFEPASGAIRQMHDRRFDAFCRLQSTAREIRNSADQLEAC